MAIAGRCLRRVESIGAVVAGFEMGIAAGELRRRRWQRGSGDVDGAEPVVGCYGSSGGGTFGEWRWPESETKLAARWLGAPVEIDGGGGFNSGGMERGWRHRGGGKRRGQRRTDGPLGRGES
ncbi:hypothetical protein E2562_029778 [Oryza meyeriana var. granulata]|uniref:Uncharacterized protein n=1 Tax=Oryza meyeriana var. granulata TaxID=110450 RepID=A0A6G1E4Y8_9ORYZ|nr:hypothetical protein E2562_029778 [Oryza meyeriana var. granulata]